MGSVFSGGKKSRERGGRQEKIAEVTPSDSLLIDSSLQCQSVTTCWSQRQSGTQTTAWLTHRGMVSVLLLINLSLGLYMLCHNVYKKVVYKTHSVLCKVPSFFLLSQPVLISVLSAHQKQLLSFFCLIIERRETLLSAAEIQPPRWLTCLSLPFCFFHLFFFTFKQHSRWPDFNSQGFFLFYWQYTVTTSILSPSLWWNSFFPFCCCLQARIELVRVCPLSICVSVDLRLDLQQLCLCVIRLSLL